MAYERSQTCCFTGHRPAKLPWGSDERDPRCLALKRSILRELERLYRLGYRHFISGMALGCDLYFAEAVLELKQSKQELVLEAVIPCSGQADRWAETDRARYGQLLQQCDVLTVLEDSYSDGCMLRRNRSMIDRADLLISVYDGSGGGTGNTVQYAKERGLEIRSLWL